VQRWSTPGAAGPPTGLALIGEDPAGAAFVQHYFDSRGVARVYAMDVAGGVWTLSRPAAGPGSDFAQRFEGFLVDRDSRIDGRWHREDGGRWHIDFALRYERIG
jgi:hypothetical protein